MFKLSCGSITLALLLLICFGKVSAQEPSKSTDPQDATLRIKFVFDGEIPPQALLDGSMDPFCAGCKIPDERLIIGAKGELKNVALIWDERRNQEVAKRKFAQVPQRVEMEFKNCRLSPRIVVARAGQEVVVHNRDKTGHSANFSLLNNTPSGLLAPVGGPQIVKLDTSEPAPMPIECNVHPWERAFLIVKEHPFVGVSSDEGVIEIQGLPVGNQWFRIWHESSDKNFQHVKWNGTQTLLTKGRIEFKLAPGLNELGVIQLNAEQFLVETNKRPK